MNINVLQLKKSIREKLEAINDTEYLASLDAVLTYETVSSDDQFDPSSGKLKQTRWKNNSPMMKALNWLNRK